MMAGGVLNNWWRLSGAWKWFRGGIPMRLSIYGLHSCYLKNYQGIKSIRINNMAWNQSNGISGFKAGKLCTDVKLYRRSSNEKRILAVFILFKSGKAFVKAWCKLWVETNIPDGMGDKWKVVTASLYLTSSGLFSIGDTYEPEDLLVKCYGNCVSGGKLLVSMCEALIKSRK